MRRRRFRHLIVAANVAAAPRANRTAPHDYKRHGTASLYAVDVLTGNVMGRITQRHRAKEFLDFMRQIDKATDATLDLHVTLDNSSTHNTAQIKT